MQLPNINEQLKKLAEPRPRKLTRLDERSAKPATLTPALKLKLQGLKLKLRTRMHATRLALGPVAFARQRQTPIYGPAAPQPIRGTPQEIEPSQANPSLPPEKTPSETPPAPETQPLDGPSSTDSDNS